MDYENAILDEKEAMADADMGGLCISSNVIKIRPLEQELMSIKSQRNKFYDIDFTFLQHEFKIRDRLDSVKKIMIIGGLGSEGGKESVSE